MSDIVESSGNTLPEGISGLTDMSEVARRVAKGESITDIVPEDTVDNLKVFLLVYARSQVTRAIKLTTTLEVMEDRLIDEYMEHPEKYDAYGIMKIIGTITTSLNNAINLIRTVTSDESFVQLVYNDNRVQTHNEFNVVQSTVDLSTQESREKVRLLAGQLLKKIDESCSTMKSKENK